MKDIDLRPVFVRLASHIRDRIIHGEWLPGQLLPGEESLAREFKVSVGTVRKAFDALSAQGLVTRHRGRGTFVSRATDERAFTSFFRLVSRTDGNRRLPADKILLRERASADDAEKSALDLKPGDFVYRLRRLREFEGKPLVLETVSFPFDLVGGNEWGDDKAAAHLVYSFLEHQCGVSISRVEDKLQAAILPPDLAGDSGLPAGHPVLLCLRTAFDLRGMPVEFRRSWLFTDDHDYLSELRWAGFTESD
ncbi:GntR family transcriptional regulator [Achromobacter sp. Marseille-Q4962]|uniref:GntR family transcriptional regulator n=1 Tax=Achromobacter sp. Marseille-Q4962 TaxID=2942202 RepID=UPI00207316A3|nr:GntR family transcriptional regulator [Achromobacter sp. Marseille-Q4962]